MDISSSLRSLRYSLFTNPVFRRYTVSDIYRTVKYAINTENKMLRFAFSFYKYSTDYSLRNAAHVDCPKTTFSLWSSWILFV